MQTPLAFSKSLHIPNSSKLRSPIGTDHLTNVSPTTLTPGDLKVSSPALTPIFLFPGTDWFL